MSESEREAHTDAVILELLLEEDAQRPWSVDELARELDASDVVADSLGRLVRAGLVHRLDGFVFASRAALRAGALAEQH